MIRTGFERFVCGSSCFSGRMITGRRLCDLSVATAGDSPAASGSVALGRLHGSIKTPRIVERGFIALGSRHGRRWFRKRYDHRRRRLDRPLNLDDGLPDQTLHSTCRSPPTPPSWLARSSWRSRFQLLAPWPFSAVVGLRRRLLGRQSLPSDDSRSADLLATAAGVLLASSVAMSLSDGCAGDVPGAAAGMGCKLGRAISLAASCAGTAATVGVWLAAATVWLSGGEAAAGAISACCPKSLRGNSDLE